MDINDDTAKAIIENCRHRSNVWLLTLPLNFTSIAALTAAILLQISIRSYGATHSDEGETYDVTRSWLIFNSVVFLMLTALAVFLFILWVKNLRKCRNKLSTFLVSFTLSVILTPINIWLIFAILE